MTRPALTPEERWARYDAGIVAVAALRAVAEDTIELLGATSTAFERVIAAGSALRVSECEAAIQSIARLLPPPTCPRPAPNARRT